MKRINLDDFRMEGERILLLRGDFHRARNVLRADVGDTLVGTDGRGVAYSFTVTEILPDRLVGRVSGTLRGAGESPLAVTLAQAVPRGQRMDLVVQKATELGVERIVPLLTARSVVRPSVGGGQRLGRWEKIAAEAVAQCRRSLKPRIDPPTPLGEFLRETCAPLRIVLHCGESTVRFSSLPDANPGRVEAVVGPEGGFSAAEIRACLDAGCTAVSLGPRVLRAETAGLAILTLLQHRWGDLD